MKQSRRQFLQRSFPAALGICAGTGLLPETLWAQAPDLKERFPIAVQAYSLGPLFMSGKLSILDFPKMVSDDFGATGAEYWNLTLAAQQNNQSFLRELRQRADDTGVTNTLMLVDLINLKDRSRGPSLVSPVAKERKQAVAAHQAWMDTAKAIGCSAIRVNLWAEGLSADAVLAFSVDSLGQLLDYGHSMNMSIVIENHGGYTSDAKWLVQLMQQINHPLLGTLPDFGTANFCIERAPAKPGEFYSKTCLNQYDKYKGVAEMLPFAKGISAKATQFDAKGEAVETDFKRMMSLIKASKFSGFIAIEYEGAMMQQFGGGNYLPPKAGVLAIKALIEKYR